MALDSEADDELVSPVEQLRSVFDLCDKDSDGQLTVSEFRTLAHQFLGAATQQVEKLIKELDPEKSGVINFENFRKGIESFLLARRESSSSSLSGSCLSLNGFGDDPILTSSPTGGGNTDTVHDLYHNFSNTTKRSLSYQFNNNNASELDSMELIGDEENDHLISQERQLRQEPSKSLTTLEVQPSGISPSLMARALAKKNNHSYLQVSGGGGASVGSYSYDSTPEWIDDDHDELTDKLQELSSRLEGLEVDLDSSQAQTLHLRRENTSLRDRIDTYEERVRELEITMKRTEKDSAELLKQTKVQLKRKHEEEMDELIAELHDAQDRIKQLESANSMVRSSLEEANQDCELRREESHGLRMRINELEEEVQHTKEIFKAESNRLEKERQGAQQEVEAMTHVIEHLRKELEDGKISKKRNAVTTSDIKNGEIAILKKEIKSLQEANDRLSSQLLQQGKKLMAEQPKSLLEELEDAPRNEVMKALKDQEEYNDRLKAYIEGLLVTIIEKHPELLEVKTY